MGGKEELAFDPKVTNITRIGQPFAALPKRFVWVQFVEGNKPFDAELPDDSRLRPVNSYGRFDVIDRTVKSWFAGPHHILQEPTFVPRSTDAAEGDGYLLGTVHNLAEVRSELVIVDAATMAE